MTGRSAMSPTAVVRRRLRWQVVELAQSDVDAILFGDTNGLW